MTNSVSSDSIYVGFPPSLTDDQIQEFPSYTSISTPPLLTAPKIATAYNIPASTGANVKVGIISLGGGFSPADLANSMANLGLTTGNVTFVGVDGATNNYTGTNADGENTLDLVCVAGMVPSANIVLYKANGSQGFNSYATTPSNATSINSNTSFGNAIQRAVDDNCDVITISWGRPERIKSGNTIYYCGDYLSGPLANAAAKNICVFVASGDYGSSAANAVVTSAIGNIVNIDYPSGNPNVTAVGGTFLTLYGNNTRNTETVYNKSVPGPLANAGFGGSGGVSSWINLPSYQTNLTYNTYPGNVANSLTTRGVPDISAAMNAYGYWLGNTVHGGSGTSASAPIMAGMVARFISLNGGRRPPGGSAGLNKMLYQNTGSFFDIPTGNNASLLPTGYAATPGWDAATGLGSQYNATQTYQSVTSAGVRVKTNAGWAPVKNISVKNNSGTWAAVNKVWTKTVSGWQQVY